VRGSSWNFLGERRAVERENKNIHISSLRRELQKRQSKKIGKKKSSENHDAEKKRKNIAPSHHEGLEKKR